MSSARAWTHNTGTGERSADQRIGRAVPLGQLGGAATQEVGDRTAAEAGDVRAGKIEHAGLGNGCRERHSGRSPSGRPDGEMAARRVADGDDARGVHVELGEVVDGCRDVVGSGRPAAAVALRGGTRCSTR